MTWVNLHRALTCLESFRRKEFLAKNCSGYKTFLLYIKFQQFFLFFRRERDMTFQQVARMHGTNSVRCAGKDQVTRLKGNEF